MRWALLLTLALLGCKGPAGPPGPEGPPGEPGAPGSGATGRLVWKDATEAVVAYDAPQFEDSNGYLWTLNAETARPIPITSALYYAQVGCAGAAAVVAVLPRTPLRLEGEADFYIRPDNAASSVVAVKSFRTSAQATCTATTATMRVVLLSSMRNARPAQEPAWPFVPPLHAERE